jgi:hypothetical protein
MIRAEQIPDEVVEAAARAILKETGSFNEARAAIAAALSAWPGATTRGFASSSRPNDYNMLILLLPVEASE